MVTVRWLRLSIRSFGRRGGAHGGADVDAWLDTVHRLARARAAERDRLAPRAAEVKARLSDRD